jgi:predicted acylesterase/phospholipase RssA
MSAPGARAGRNRRLAAGDRLVDNLPVSLAREMGADILIAVDVSFAWRAATASVPARRHQPDDRDHGAARHARVTRAALRSGHLIEPTSGA